MAVKSSKAVLAKSDSSSESSLNTGPSVRIWMHAMLNGNNSEADKAEGGNAERETASLVSDEQMAKDPFIKVDKWLGEESTDFSVKPPVELPDF